MASAPMEIHSGELESMYEKIRTMKKLARELEAEAGTFPGIQRNAVRILASIKMMELNMGDVLEFDLLD